MCIRDSHNCFDTAEMLRKIFRSRLADMTNPQRKDKAMQLGLACYLKLGDYCRGGFFAHCIQAREMGERTRKTIRCFEH